MDYTFPDIEEIDIKSIEKAIKKSDMTNKDVTGCAFSGESETLIISFEGELNASDLTKLEDIVDNAYILLTYLCYCSNENMYYEMHSDEEPVQCPNGHNLGDVYEVTKENKTGSGISPDGGKWNLYITNDGEIVPAKYSEDY